MCEVRPRGCTCSRTARRAAARLALALAARALRGAKHRHAHGHSSAKRVPRRPRKAQRIPACRSAGAVRRAERRCRCCRPPPAAPSPPASRRRRRRRRRRAPPTQPLPRRGAPIQAAATCIRCIVIVIAAWAQRSRMGMAGAPRGKWPAQRSLRPAERRWLRAVEDSLSWRAASPPRPQRASPPEPRAPRPKQVPVCRLGFGRARPPAARPICNAVITRSLDRWPARLCSLCAARWRCRAAHGLSRQQQRRGGNQVPRRSSATSLDAKEIGVWGRTKTKRGIFR